MTMNLRKYKKIELIDLLLEYEEEISNLKIECSLMKIDFDSKVEAIEIERLEILKSKSENKKIDYLINRIRIMNGKSKIIYINELNRIGNSV